MSDKNYTLKDKVIIAGVTAGEFAKEAAKATVQAAKDVDVKKVARNVGDKTKKAASTVKKAASTSGKKIKETVITTKEKVTEKVDEIDMTKLLDACYDKAINGFGKELKAEELAVQYISKYKDVNKAVKSLVNTQIKKCGTSGFITGLGGLVTLPVAIPTNIASVAYVQLRMIAAIASIGGYNPRDDEVQTLSYVCLTGQAMGDVLKEAGIKVGERAAVAALKKLPGSVLTKINQKIGFRFITKFGEKGVVNISKMIPVLGGIIGGGLDIAGTKIIANNAIKAFLSEEFVVSDDDLCDVEIEITE